MSKIEKICNILDAAGHVMGADGLKRYHDARKIRDGLRATDYLERAKAVAKNYRLRVERSIIPGDKIVLSTFDRSIQVSI